MEIKKIKDEVKILLLVQTSCKENDKLIVNKLWETSPTYSSMTIGMG